MSNKGIVTSICWHVFWDMHLKFQCWRWASRPSPSHLIQNMPSYQGYQPDITAEFWSLLQCYRKTSMSHGRCLLQRSRVCLNTSHACKLILGLLPGFHRWPALLLEHLWRILMCSCQKGYLNSYKRKQHNYTRKLKELIQYSCYDIKLAAALMCMNAGFKQCTSKEPSPIFSTF